MPATTAEPVYEVVWPLGRRGGLPRTDPARRLRSLDDATVAFVWDHVFRGDEMFARFEQVASRRFHGMAFVPHDVFGNIHGTASEEHQAVDELPKRLLEHGVDAAIVGVGA